MQDALRDHKKSKELYEKELRSKEEKIQSEEALVKDLQNQIKLIKNDAEAEKKRLEVEFSETMKQIKQVIDLLRIFLMLIKTCEKSSSYVMMCC